MVTQFPNKQDGYRCEVDEDMCCLGCIRKRQDIDHGCVCLWYGVTARQDIFIFFVVLGDIYEQDISMDVLIPEIGGGTCIGNELFSAKYYFIGIRKFVDTYLCKWAGREQL